MITINKQVDGRTQKLSVVDELLGNRITAMRWRITSKKYCPWLVAEGEELLPKNAIKRGIQLSHIWKMETI